MKKALRYGIALASLVLLGSMAFAQVTITMPLVLFPTDSADTTQNDIAAALNDQFADTASGPFADAITGMTSTINGQLGKFDKQEKLALGFGNATAYAGQGATMQGYQGYKLFSVMAGGIAGFQLPSMNIDEIAEIPGSMMKESDVYAGIAGAVPVFNIGINAETVFGLIGLGDVFNNMYFNLKFGGGKINENFTFESKKYAVDIESFTLGMGVNYQLLPSIGLLGGFVRWRGINLGAGLTIQNSSFVISLPFDTMSESVSVPVTVGSDTYTATGTMEAVPTVRVGSTVTTFTIPLEATTSIQTLWLFNVNFGLGADFVFGNSDVVAEATSPINLGLAVDGMASLSPTITPGSVKLDLGTRGVSPSLTRMRIMAGLGNNFGPLKLDVPLYYYLNSGFAIGVTLGVVW
ncbi:MAG: hypothetical protein EWM51_04665 [Treponema sp.]|nr:MAG: hypothetical protein EWM51_04665 [Treponema sp.]